ncbi:hypothetical protein ScPMuIL_017216 [Solemya velum]
MLTAASYPHQPQKSTEHNPVQLHDTRYSLNLLGIRIRMYTSMSSLNYPCLSHGDQLSRSDTFLHGLGRVDSRCFRSSNLLPLLPVSKPPLLGDSGWKRNILEVPTNLNELRSVAATLQEYKSGHIGYVFCLFISLYLYKQTFAIPGSVFLNVLAGALFGTWQAFLLVCLLTATGATFCFLLSQYFGKWLIIEYFPQKIQSIQEKVQNNMGSLFFYLLFVRLFPMSPNWFMNMVSPIINIPVHLFFPTVLIGLMPYNFVCVQTGSMLSQITSMDDILSKWMLLKLLAMALVSLLPGLVVHRMKGLKIKSE